jgi:sugar phosphate isomerase/epimerase
MPLAAFPKCFLRALVVERTMTVDQWIDLAADQLDVDGLEFYWGFVPRHDPAELRRLRRKLASRGLAMPMMCVSPDFTVADRAARAAEVAEHRRAIEATAELGGSYCRVLSGQRRPGLEVEDGVRMVADCIAELLPHAESHGVVLTLENHYKDSHWAYPEFAQRIAVFRQLLDAIPHTRWFGVNYDPSNTLIAGEDPLEMLELVKRRVVTMHASDRYFVGGTAEDLRRQEVDPAVGYAAILRHGVIGRGLNDYDRIFSILAAVGFAGWVSIEDGDDPAVGMEHLRLSAEFLRSKMAQHGLDRSDQATPQTMRRTAP